MDDENFTKIKKYLRHNRTDANDLEHGFTSFPRRSVANLRKKFASALEYGPTEKIFSPSKIAKKLRICRTNFRPPSKSFTVHALPLQYLRKTERPRHDI